MIRIAILDDYQNASLEMADWSPLAGRAVITVFNDHLSNFDKVVERLLPFDVVCVMRERTPLPRSVIGRLPRLKLIASTGPRNAAIDVEAAAERGIVVAHTGYDARSTIEMTWALILANVRQVALEKVNTQEKNLTDFDKENFNMPLNGEYEPSPSERVRRQVELYEATNGAEGGTQNGKPVIVLTSQGAKSGKIRKIPLMRIEHNGVYAVVASHAGAPKNPFWYYNLVANPLVELQDGAVKQDMRAREVFGAEKAEWWKRADAAYSAFPNYRARAGREIPLFVIEPVEAAQSTNRRQPA